MFANIGTLEVVIIVAVIFILFGGKKLPELARGITNASKEFNKGFKGEDPKKPIKKED